MRNSHIFTPLKTFMYLGGQISAKAISLLYSQQEQKIQRPGIPRNYFSLHFPIACYFAVLLRVQKPYLLAI
jgi:hypothetical protein